MLDHSNLNSSDQYQLLNCQSQIEITTNSTKNLKQSLQTSLRISDDKRRFSYCFISVMRNEL